MWKTLLKVLAGATTGGGLSYAGVEIYGTLTPELWSDFLVREGYRIVPKSNTEHWKGMKKLKKDTFETKKSTYTDLTDINNLDTWCEQEFKKVKERDYQKKKEDLVSLCIYGDGKPKSDREAMAMSGDKYKDWISEESETTTQTEEYERMFAVYKYKLKDKPDGEELRFLNWLNEGVEEASQLKNDSKNAEGGKKLAERCKGFGKSDGQDYLWWCRKLDYKTIIDKIKKDEGSDWTPQSDGSAIKTRWEKTDQATQKIKTALSKGEADTLEDNDYKTFCEESGSIAKKDLKDEGVYQDIYIAYKSVCSPAPAKA